MSKHSLQPRSARRTPVMGVGGITLLMLVTMALTASPGLTKTTLSGPVGVTSERAVRADLSAETSGPRQSSERRVRPSRVAVAANIRQSHLPQTSVEHGSIARAQRDVADLGLRAELLNLPPPARA